MRVCIMLCLPLATHSLKSSQSIYTKPRLFTGRRGVVGRLLARWTFRVTGTRWMQTASNFTAKRYNYIKSLILLCSFSSEFKLFALFQRLGRKITPYSSVHILLFKCLSNAYIFGPVAILHVF